MSVRVANPNDVPKILALIKELASFELQPDAVVNTVEELNHDLFVDKRCFALVYESNEDILGFALYYFGYSTWKGKTLYLEDIYVKESNRKKGIGQAIFDEVVAIAKHQQVRRMDWQVLAWNEAALKFYTKNHATLDDEWINGRLFF
ncbi:MAG: GNAT family N-acetyltransferase [Flavobacteriia bacterium]|nr:GNAT family N-acetyltransferase [Flavobacteriia bacterium]NBX38241.1 GNAT family N-acetyltransferase [Flavobacteriia bacterium]